MLQLTLAQSTAPFGNILLVTDDAGRLRALDYPDHRTRMHRLLREHYGEHMLSPGSLPSTAGRGRITHGPATGLLKPGVAPA